jgi:hypothetical protein
MMNIKRFDVNKKLALTIIIKDIIPTNKVPTKALKKDTCTPIILAAK